MGSASRWSRSEELGVLSAAPLTREYDLAAASSTSTTISSISARTSRCFVRTSGEFQTASKSLDSDNSTRSATGTSGCQPARSRASHSCRRVIAPSIVASSSAATRRLSGSTCSYRRGELHAYSACGVPTGERDGARRPARSHCARPSTQLPRRAVRRQGELPLRSRGLVSARRTRCTARGHASPVHFCASAGACSRAPVLGRRDLWNCGHHAAP